MQVSFCYSPIVPSQHVWHCWLCQSEEMQVLLIVENYGSYYPGSTISLFFLFNLPFLHIRLKQKKKVEKPVCNRRNGFETYILSLSTAKTLNNGPFFWQTLPIIITLVLVPMMQVPLTRRFMARRSSPGSLRKVWPSSRMCSSVTESW